MQKPKSNPKSKKRNTKKKKEKAKGLKHGFRIGEAKPLKILLWNFIQNLQNNMIRIRLEILDVTFLIT